MAGHEGGIRNQNEKPRKTRNEKANNMGHGTGEYNQ